MSGIRVAILQERGVDKMVKGIRKSMSSSIITGIDLGERSSVATVLSPDGEIKDRFSFSMNQEGYAQFSSRVPKDARLAFEATTISYPFSRSLKELGYEDVTVAHPTELTWITRSKKKNDEADSLKIAKLHLAGLLPESHLLSREEQIERDLLIQRAKLGAEIGRMKVRILSYLKREGVCESLPKTKDNFSVARKLAISSLRFNDNRDLVLKTMLDRLNFFEKQCEPLEREMRKTVKDSKYARIIMSVPGIDYYLASLYASYIGDPHRFPSFDHVASFLGIIPESKDSANVKRRGRMSKDGPSIARWALSVMVDSVILHNPNLRTYYHRAKERTGGGGYAHVLTMKKLARMLHHMMITEQNWKWEDAELTERKLANLDRVEEGGVPST
jgi:transposase